MDELPVIDERFRAMGTEVHLVVVGGDRGHLALARNRIDTLERRWSRFRPDSEISLLNAAGGEPMHVSADTATLVTMAQHAWRLTGGSFDPSLLHALRAAGYDRSFEQLARRSPDAPRPGESPRRRQPVPGPEGTGSSVLTLDRSLVVDIDVRGHVVTFPADLGFDPGGIGKGLAADLVSELLLEAGAAGCCVNLGGDLRVRGRSPRDEGWTLSIDHPAASEPIALVGLHDGALASSTVLCRTWLSDGTPRHHLLDPLTAEPTTSDIAFSSVIAGDAWLAEVLAKSALLRGTTRAFDLLGRGAAGLVVDHDGRVHTSVSMAHFTGGVWPAATIAARPT